MMIGGSGVILVLVMMTVVDSKHTDNTETKYSRNSDSKKKKNIAGEKKKEKKRKKYSLLHRCCSVFSPDEYVGWCIELWHSEM